VVGILTSSGEALPINLALTDIAPWRRAAG